MRYAKCPKCSTQIDLVKSLSSKAALKSLLCGETLTVNCRACKGVFTAQLEGRCVVHEDSART